ncbi:MAG: CHASE domain-containing protein [Methylovulum sp.]|nr:CHASE domain-containing protein [Methylovulum sp.]
MNNSSATGTGKKNLRRIRSLILSGLVLAVALTVTHTLYDSARQAAAQELQANFNFREHETIARIQQRMTVYQQVLLAARGLFIASENVDRNEFSTYIASLDIDQNYPGIQGVGYAAAIPSAQKNRHITGMRKQGFPAYSLYPDGERELYSAIVFIEPFSGRNLRAFGYDMYSEPVRREAMVAARDENRLTISGKVILVQETDGHKQAGFLMYLPVYKNQLPYTTPAERLANIAGWVYLPFRMGDLMAGLEGERNLEMDLEIYDGNEPSAAALLYDKDGIRVAGNGAVSRLQSTRQLMVANRHWTITISALPEFAARMDQNKAGLIAKTGITLSLLLTLLTFSLTNSRERAIYIAGEKTGELIKNAADMRLLLESTGEAIYGIDMQGNCTFANASCIKGLGYQSADDLLGKNMQGLIHYKKADGSPLSVEDCLIFLAFKSGQKVHIVDEAIWRADGSCFPAEYWSYPQYLNGQVVGAVVTFIDITARKKAENNIRESEERLNLALQGVGDGVWDWNIQTGSMLFSKGFNELHGFAESEFGKTVDDWISRIYPDDWPALANCLQAYLTGETGSYRARFRVLCKNNSYMWVLGRGMIVSRTAGGEPLRMVGTHTDITEQIQAEQTIDENKQDLDAVFAQIPDGIVVFDHQDKVSHVNDTFCNMIGLQNQQLLGIDEAAFNAMLLERRVNDDDNLDNKRQAVFSITSTTNTSSNLMTLQRTLIGLNQRRISHILYFRDITNESLVERMKSEFVSTAAHELRTPMSIIFGYSELLQQQTFDEAAQKRMMTAINEQSKSIINILNELLDIARIEARAGKVFNLELIRPAPLIQELVDSFMMAGDERRPHLHLNSALPELMLDSEKIKQVLKNCLSNAFKFSPADQDVNLYVDMAETEGKPAVAIAIEDHGIGMTPEQLDRVFEKFYRANTSGKSPGTGLGMALVKEIIEHHNGSVQINSEYGKGTTVTLYLPVPEGAPALSATG